VSFQKLSTVSTYFATLLLSEFSGTEKKEDAKWHIDAENFHPDALMHVLNITHDCSQRVPLDVSVEILTHMAFIFDYYDIRHTIMPWLREWGSALQIRARSNSIHRDHILWLYVSRQFGLVHQFRSVARCILTYCDDFTNTHGVPVDNLLEKLFQRRMAGAGLVLRSIDSLTDQLHSREIGCSNSGCYDYINTYITEQRERLCPLVDKKGVSFASIMNTMITAGPWFKIGDTDSHFDSVVLAESCFDVSSRAPCCSTARSLYSPLSLTSAIKHASHFMQNFKVEDLRLVLPSPDIHQALSFFNLEDVDP
jgi:hypothetical protein